MPLEQYPELPEGNATDVFHGEEVAHPFKWMEDVANPDVRHWLDVQSELTDNYLADSAYGSKIRTLLESMPEYVAARLSWIRGTRRFQFEKLLGHTRPVLTMREGEEIEIVLAPGQRGLSQDLRLYEEFVYISPSGRYVAFASSNEASDLQSIVVWDIELRQITGDATVPVLNPVVAWLPDESGFFYNVNTSPAPGSGSLHFRDRISGVDKSVFEFLSGDAHAALPYVAPDGRYLFVKTLNFVTQRAGLLASRLDIDGEFIRIFDDCEAFLNITGVQDDILYLETDWDAPRMQIISVNLAGKVPVERETIVPEQKHPIARSTHTVSSTKSCLVGDQLFVTYLVDVSSRIRRFFSTGEFLANVHIPAFSTVNEIRPSEQCDGLDISVSTFLIPHQHLHYQAANHEMAIVSEHRLTGDQENIVIRQEFCRSPDGTQIPMFIISPENPSSKDRSPVLLYGYGGWGIPLVPSFSAEAAAWTALGGTYVVANLRGGGEYGRQWHEMGKGLNKQNVFDDFCSVAEYLIAKDIATPDTLSIKGLSNGGLLVAACVNRRPELFAAAVMEVPLVDVLNLMDTPIGIPVSEELGNPVAHVEDFKYIRSYSPFQNIQPDTQRPDVFVVVADKDERAPPSAAYKYLARLQATADAEQVALLRVIEREGHTGWSRTNTMNATVDEFCFLFLAMDRVNRQIEHHPGDRR